MKQRGGDGNGEKVLLARLWPVEVGRCFVSLAGAWIVKWDKDSSGGPSPRAEETSSLPVLEGCSRVKKRPPECRVDVEVVGRVDRQLVGSR